MARIPEESLAEIRSRLDIVDVVGRYVSLKRSGNNFLGLCPFHDEKTPSFNVNSGRQIFHCFGCGAGGNVFTFVMRMEGLSFPEAARYLAEQAGVKLAEETPQSQQQASEREQLGRIMELSWQFYCQQLQSSQGRGALDYLQQRGYNYNFVQNQGLGYAPAGWENLAGYLKGQGVSLGMAARLGLVRPRKTQGYYDLLRDRLVFPVQDSQGRIVAFAGRSLDGSQPKYINTPESPIYHKSRELFGLYQVRRQLQQENWALVVEGYFDQLAVWQAQAAPAVATCGTALTREHARQLRRYCQQVVLLFDGDEAGQKAAQRALRELLPSGLEIRIAQLEPGSDPDSLLKEQGTEALSRVLAQAQGGLDWLRQHLWPQGASSPELQARALEELVGYIHLLPKPLEQDLHIQRLAAATGVAEQSLRRQLRPEQGNKKFQPAARIQPEQARQAEDGLLRAQYLLLQVLLEAVSMRSRVREQGLQEVFLDPACRRLAAFIVPQTQEGTQLAQQLLDDPSLEPDLQQLLSRLLTMDEAAIADEHERIFVDCCQRVKRQRLLQRRQQLRQQLHETAQAGDQAQLQALQNELVDVNRQLKIGH